MASFFDDFNRANENLETSPNWTLIGGPSGSAKVSSNRIRCDTDDSTGSAYRCPDLGSADHKTQVLWQGPAIGLVPFICVRLVDANNYIGARYTEIDGGTIELYKRVAGSFTLLDTSTTNQGPRPITLRLEAQGDTLRVFNGSTEVCSATDSFNNTVTTQGLNPRSQSFEPWFDDFLAETFLADATATLTGAAASGQAGTLTVQTGATEGWFNPDWLYRKKIAIQASQVPGDITNYLATISLRDGDIQQKSRTDGRDIVITQSDGVTQVPHVLQSRKLLVDHGVWSWFSNPRAVYHNGVNEKTYWVSVADGGDIDIHSYDHKTGAIEHFTLDPALEDDDHNHGAIYIRSDGRLFVMWSKHTADDKLHYRLSTNAEDISAWGVRQTLTMQTGRNTTYQNPIYLDTPGKLVMVYRSKNASLGSDTEWRYIISDDEGSTWNTTEIPLWKTATEYSGYFIWAKNGTDRADLIFTDSHPTFDSSTSTYHMYMAWDVGTASIKFYKSDGTEITSTKPYGTADATLVWDGSVESSWIWDVVIDGSGNPHLAFTRFPTQTDHRYYYTTWDGSAWTTPVQITAAGNSLAPATEPNYSGGIYFNRAASIPHNEVYLVIESSNVFEVQKWTNSAGWAKTDDITTGSTTGVKQGRPIVPWGQPAGKRLEVLWWSGFYDHNITFRTPMYGHPFALHNAVSKLPSVSGSVDTDIYIYYGNSAAVDQQDQINTWANLYAALDFDIVPGTRKSLDLTGNGHDATFPVISALSILHAEDALLDMGTAVSLSKQQHHYSTLEMNFAALTAFSVDALIKWGGGSTDKHTIFSCWGDNTKSDVLFRIDPGTSRLQGYVIVEANTSKGGEIAASSVGTADYEKVSLLFDTTSLDISDNGAISQVIATGAQMDANVSRTSYIGKTNPDHPTTNGDYFSGVLTALTIGKTKPSSDYLTAQRNNQIDLSNFYVLGTEETNLPEASIALSGVSSAGQPGTITSIGAALLALSGASSTGQAGTLTVQTTSGAIITLSGVSGTGDAGSLTATGAALLTATGAQSAGQAGTLSATGGAILNLSGTEGTGQAGSVTSLGGALSELTGVSSEGQPGTVTIEVAGGVSVTLSGIQSSGQAGTLTAITGASFALTGIASAGQAGTLTVTTAEGATVTLTGVQAVSGVGDIGILTGATVNLSGTVGTGQAGTVTVTVPGTITIDLTFKTALILSAEDTSLTLQ